MQFLQVFTGSATAITSAMKRCSAITSINLRAPLSYALASLLLISLFLISVILMIAHKTSRARKDAAVGEVLGSAYYFVRGCVSPASWLSLFTQYLIDHFALQCRRNKAVKVITTEVS